MDFCACSKQVPASLEMKQSSGSWGRMEKTKGKGMCFFGVCLPPTGFRQLLGFNSLWQNWCNGVHFRGSLISEQWLETPCLFTCSSGLRVLAGDIEKGANPNLESSINWNSF